MELTRFQKNLLAALAGMLVFFGVLLAVFRTRPGVLFEESLLKITEEDGGTVYSGKAHGTAVSIAVTFPTDFETDVAFTIGTDIHDVCEVFYPTQPIETERGYTVNGIRITKNGEVLFEGGYALEENYGWYRSNGAHDMDGFVIVRPGTSDPWNGFEVDRSTALRFALGPELESRGSWGMYVFMLVCTVFAALDAAFPMTMFYLQHCCDVRDPEPSDFYLACQKAGWVVFPLLLLGGYCYALRVIP